jgi:hypothetical protein
MARPLKIAKAQAVLTITSISASTQLVTVSETLSQPASGFTSSSGEGILAGMPFVVATTVGGLTAGVTYYVNRVTGANTFSVSTTDLSVQPRVLATLTNAGPVTVKATVGIVDYGFNNPNNSNTSAPSGSNQTFGVVGGDTAIYGKQTLVNVAFGVQGTGTITVDTGTDTITGTGTAFTTELAVGSVLVDATGELIGFVDSITDDEEVVLDANSLVDVTDGTFAYATSEAGFIVRQKGKTKYLVTGTVTGITAQAYTANVANTALTPNTMSIIATNAASGTQYVSSLNDYQTELFPATVADGSLTPGSVYTIYYSGDTDWVAVGAMGNMTGVTFTATDAGGSGTGLAILSNANPDVIASFNSAAAANAYYTPSNPVVTINNA